MQVLSTMATYPLEHVAKSGKDGPLQLFQLYVIKDRNFCKRLIQRKCSYTMRIPLHHSQSQGLQQTSNLPLQSRLGVLSQHRHSVKSLAEAKSGLVELPK